MRGTKTMEMWGEMTAQNEMRILRWTGVLSMTMMMTNWMQCVT